MDLASLAMGLPLGVVLGLVLGWVGGRAQGIAEGRYRARAARLIDNRPAPAAALPPRGRSGAVVDLDRDSMAELVEASDHAAVAGGVVLEGRR